MSSSSNHSRSASSFESNTHFKIESFRLDPDRRSFLYSVLYVKFAFHTLLRTKSKVGFVKQSNRSAKLDFVHSRGTRAAKDMTLRRLVAASRIVWNRTTAPISALPH